MTKKDKDSIRFLKIYNLSGERDKCSTNLTDEPEGALQTVTRSFS